MFKIDALKSCSSYHLDVDYDHTHCTGECEDCCRCTRIMNLCVRSVCYQLVIEKVMSKKDYCTIKGYCVERILRHNGVADPDNWYVGAQPGYYGEEIGQASFEKLDALKDHLGKVLQHKTPRKMMEALLIFEYGWLLETLEKRKWTVESVSFKSVIVNQKDYYDHKLDPDISALYTCWGFPLGICVAEEDGYRLIDGHHRFSANTSPEKRKVIMVVAT